MLSTSTFLDSPAALGDGKYQVSLYFLDPSKSGYLNLGDYVQDNMGNDYEVVAPTMQPYDGSPVTVLFKTVDTLPAQDADYTSSVRTPGQIDLTPAVRTPGYLDLPSSYNPTNYEYEAFCSWVLPSEEVKSAIGDRVVDASGKEFELTYIDPVLFFSVNCRLREVERVGIAPVVGEATMYRATPNYSFFQGSDLFSTTVIQERDARLLDTLIRQTGVVSSSFVKPMQNTSVASITALRPVSKAPDGGIIASDSDGATSQIIIGVALENIGVGALGNVMLIGPNVAGAVNGLGFTPGDKVFVSESGGGYTNDYASFTGGDDTIVRIGYADCAAGAASATATDLIMFSEVVLRP